MRLCVYVCMLVCLVLAVCMCVCACMTVCVHSVCVGQMPFPPEYLAPPADRMKKERKTKTTKNEKETTGKVRVEKKDI